MSAHQEIIQVLLLVCTIGLAVFFVTRRKRARAKAGVKLGFIVFVFACVWAILRPDDLTIIANFVGVSRGTDLLLYLLVVAFMFTTVSCYIRFREQELRFSRLARSIALQTAVPPATAPEDTVVEDAAAAGVDAHRPSSPTCCRDKA